jgi:hypothetical protein
LPFFIYYALPKELESGGKGSGGAGQGGGGRIGSGGGFVEFSNFDIIIYTVSQVSESSSLMVTLEMGELLVCER